MHGAERRGGGRSCAGAGSAGGGIGIPDRRNSLTHIARRLRREPTEPERILWSRLRVDSAARFRRQVVIGSYIVDFACHRSRVVIEVDGEHHGEDEMMDRDAIRDAWLESRGYKVIRIANREIYTNLSEVLDGIGHEVAFRLKP